MIKSGAVYIVKLCARQQLLCSSVVFLYGCLFNYLNIWLHCIWLFKKLFETKNLTMLNIMIRKQKWKFFDLPEVTDLQFRYLLTLRQLLYISLDKKKIKNVYFMSIIVKLLLLTLWLLLKKSYFWYLWRCAMVQICFYISFLLYGWCKRWVKWLVLIL